ncbi:hypothetical protein [Porticoccus sp.]
MASTQYLVMVSFDTAQLASGNNVKTDFRIQVDGVTEFTHHSRTGGAGNTYDSPYVYVGVHTVAASSPKIALQGQCASSTSTVYNLNMVAIDVNDLTLGTDIYQDTDETDITLTNADFAETGAQVTFTTDSAKKYLVLHCHEADFSSNYRQMSFGVSQDGGTTEGIMSLMPITPNEKQTGGGFWVFDGTDASTTFECRGRAHSGIASKVWYRNRIIVIPDDILDFTVISQSQNIQNTPADQWNTLTTGSYTPPGTDPVLYLGHDYRVNLLSDRDNRTRITIDSTLNPATYDDTQRWGWQWRNANGAPYGWHGGITMAYEASPTAVARTVDWDTFDSVNVTEHYDITLLAIALNTGTPSGGGSSVSLSAMGDISSTTRKQLAADAGVTLTSGEALGQLQEIAQDQPDKDFMAVRENIISDLSIT